MKRYFDISVSCSHFIKKINLSIFFPFSQHWVSSISLSDFISCQSTKKPFHFPLKPPTWYLLCFSNPHTDHSLSMASSLRNTERGTSSLTSHRKNQNSHTASPLGLQGKWLYSSPASTEQPSYSGWSMSNMSESTWTHWQGPQRNSRWGAGKRKSG